MKRIISERQMRIGALLLRAGAPSEPMPESLARSLIASSKLATLWAAKGMVHVVDADSPEARMVVVQVGGPRLPDPVARIVELITEFEALDATLADEQRDAVAAILKERTEAGAPGPVEDGDTGDAAEEPAGGLPESPEEPAATMGPEGGEPGGLAVEAPAEPPAQDPWNLAGRSVGELRELARELELTEKVNMRLGEDNLREALREAIAAEG